MPTQPVRRSGHRFDSPGDGDELTSVPDFTNLYSADPSDVDRPPAKKKRSSVPSSEDNAQPKDSDRIDVDRELILALSDSFTLVRRECLGQVNNIVQDIALYAFKNCIVVAFDKLLTTCEEVVSVSTVRAIKSAVKSGLICLALVVSSDDDLFIEKYLGKEAVNIHPAVINWLIRPGESALHWATTHGPSTFHFDAHSLQNWLQAANNTAYTPPGELQQLVLELQSLGVSSSLRKYQLEGVAWMWHQLAASKDLILPTIGWLSIANAESINSHVLYHEVLRSVQPQAIVDSLQYQSQVPCCILADEMGVGKSLQVLSLILLMKHRLVEDLQVAAADPELMIAFNVNLENSRKSKKRKILTFASGDLTLPCFCGDNELTAHDIGWVQCSCCLRWRHVRCAGFDSMTAANNRTSYVCYTCSALFYYHYPLHSGAVLIIMPNTLIHQWINEIKKHINHTATTLKIAVFKIAKKPHQFQRSTAEYIASCDIVLMSFRTLKSCFHESEIDYDQLQHQSRSKYDLAPPSILGVSFRMIVIDETQNLEGSTQSQILKMACKLHSRAKISVSGTPFGAGTVSDALYLAQFLDLNPSITQMAASIQAWIDFFDTPKLPITNELRLTWLRSIFAPRFLRRSKDSIRDQLGIAEKYTLIRTLKFSRFEMKLYEDQAHAAHEELMSSSNSNKATVKLQELSRNKLELMRKGCCHPQIFDKTLKNKSNIASGAMPLDHVMIVKVEQSKQKCEETQRDLLFYLFKMAGLKLLKAMDSKETLQSITQCMIAAKIYAFALQTVIKNRSPCAAMALVQVYGDSSLTQTQVVLPCISSVALMWSRGSNSEDHQDRELQQRSQHSEQMMAVMKEMSATLTWCDSLPALLTQSSANKSSSRKKQFISGLNWHPFARLGFAHSKSLTSATFATSIENIVKVTKQLPTAGCRTAGMLQLIVFPYEISLSASDSHDAFLPVMTRKAHTPFHPSQAVGVSEEQQAVMGMGESQRLLHRCKHWKVDVLNFATEGLLLRYDQDTIHYAKVSIESWWEMVEQGLLDVHIIGELSFVETAFDADHLQELHVLHNLSYALRSLTPSSSSGNEVSKELLKHLQAPVNLIQLPQEDVELAHKIEDIMLQDQQASLYSDSSVILITPNSHMIGTCSAVATADTAVLHHTDLLDDSTTVESMISYQQSLQSRKELIQREFVNHASDRRTLAIMKLKEHAAKVTTIEADILSITQGARVWWIELLNDLKFNTNFLLDAQETVDKGEAAYSKFRTFRDINGLSFLLGQEFDGLQKARIKAIKALQHMMTAQPNDEEIQRSSNCQKCRAYFNKTGPVCAHCRVFTTALEPYRKDYLIAARRRTTQIISTGNKGKGGQSRNLATGGVDDLFDIGVDTREFDQSLTDGAYAMFLRLMRKYAPKGEELNELCRLEIKWIDAIVAENTAMVAAWDRYSELLKSYDELAQCTTRVQLATNMQEKLDKDGPERFFAAEIDTQFQDAMSLAATAEHDLKSAISSLNFFKGQVRQCQVEDRQDEDDCGICKESMSATSTATATAAAAAADRVDELVLLPCAHRFHKECAMQWVIAHKKCPLCRTPTQQHMLTLVTPSQKPQSAHSHNHYTSSSDDSKITKIDAQGQQQPIIDRQFVTFKKKVIGRWGTKIDALLTDLLILHYDQSREGEKMIIFSQWLEMLEIVSDALRINKLPFTKCFSRTKDFDSAATGIELFRSDPKIRILLLPLALGAEGLDLIIASHVFLLEPLLNRSQELQAINRIDRIGQERVTFVHKYLISETIEERIEEYQREKGGLASGQKQKKKKKKRNAMDVEQLNLTDMQFILNMEGKLGTDEADDEVEIEDEDEVNEEEDE